MFYNLDQTKKLAKTLAQNAKVADCFCLIGDLGAGKTEFSRAFIQALCGDVKVTSPTYNIVQQYGQVNHFDLYRIKHETELEEIGFEEMLQTGINLIEWPQIAANLIPATAKKIEIKIIDENLREIICS